MLNISISGVVGLVCFSTVSLTTVSANAASVDFSSWDKFGDSQSIFDNSTLRSRSRFGINANILEQNIGLANNSLDIGGNALTGSGAKAKYKAQAGDTFNFNWSFSSSFSSPTSDKDFAFFSVNGNIFKLSYFSFTFTDPIGGFRKMDSNFYTYTFPTMGNYDISFGVVNINDSSNFSNLDIRNTTTTATPVPEPISVLSSIVALGFGNFLRKRYNIIQN